MNTLQISDERIMTVWGWCSEAYIRHGIKLQFPAHTNPTKTYQWRYAKSITQKFAEWDFDTPTAVSFIDIAVAHVKDAGLLRKGLAVLHQTNMLEICYQKLKSQSDTNCQASDSLLLIHKWFTQRVGENILRTLLHRDDVGELCNLVKWVGASKISPLYLSLSRVCGRAMKRLAETHSEEREMLPPITKLYMLRSEFLQEAHNATQIRKILNRSEKEVCR